MPRKSIDKTIYLNEESCHKYGLSINEAIDLLSIDKSSNVRTTLMQLLDKKLIYPEYDANYNIKQWFLTETGKNTLVSIISDSKGSNRTDEQLIRLCKDMQSIFPKGRKLGENGMGSYYWRCNTMEVVDKLKNFFLKFGDIFSDEEVLDATRRYVDSFHGNYRYMCLLKYFISKDDTSKLLTFLENKNQEDEQTQQKEDWTQTLV